MTQQNLYDLCMNIIIERNKKYGDYNHIYSNEKLKEFSLTEKDFIKTMLLIKYNRIVCIYNNRKSIDRDSLLDFINYVILYEKKTFGHCIETLNIYSKKYNDNMIDTVGTSDEMRYKKPEKMYAKIVKNNYDNNQKLLDLLFTKIKEIDSLDPEKQESFFIKLTPILIIVTIQNKHRLMTRL